MDFTRCLPARSFTAKTKSLPCQRMEFTKCTWVANKTAPAAATAQ